MKDFFLNLTTPKGRDGKDRKLSGKKQAMRELIVTPHAVIIAATAIRLDKRKQAAEKHNRRKEATLTENKQIHSTHNFEQRLLEKQKTRQKTTRRRMAA